VRQWITVEVLPIPSGQYRALHWSRAELAPQGRDAERERVTITAPNKTEMGFKGISYLLYVFGIERENTGLATPRLFFGGALDTSIFGARHPPHWLARNACCTSSTRHCQALGQDGNER